MALCWGSPKNKKTSKTTFTTDQPLGKAGLGKLRYLKKWFWF